MSCQVRKWLQPAKFVRRVTVPYRYGCVLVQYRHGFGPYGVYLTSAPDRFFEARFLPARLFQPVARCSGTMALYAILYTSHPDLQVRLPWSSVIIANPHRKLLSGQAISYFLLTN